MKIRYLSQLCCSRVASPNMKVPRPLRGDEEAVFAPVVLCYSVLRVLREDFVGIFRGWIYFSITNFAIATVFLGAATAQQPEPKQSTSGGTQSSSRPRASVNPKPGRPMSTQPPGPP